MLNRYLVAYDISDDRRRNAVFKLMHGYGDRLQYSVFRCDLSEANKVRMQTGLAEVVDHRNDQVLIFNLGPVDGLRADSVEYIGVVCKPADHDAMVV
jgi:CRISPR-associated protein Cas2